MESIKCHRTNYGTSNVIDYLDKCVFAISQRVFFCFVLFLVAMFLIHINMYRKH